MAMAAGARLAGRVSLVVVALALLVGAGVYGFFGSASSPADGSGRRVLDGTLLGAENQGRSRKVTICHRTSSATNPYRRIRVSRNALPAHRRHGDIVPAPRGGCPGPYGHKDGKDGKDRDGRDGKDD